jgi:hypothetical protein
LIVVNVLIKRWCVWHFDIVILSFSKVDERPLGEKRSGIRNDRIQGVFQIVEWSKGLILIRHLVMDGVAVVEGWPLVLLVVRWILHVPIVLLVAVIVSIVSPALIGSVLIPMRLMWRGLGVEILALVVVLVLILTRTLWHTGVMSWTVTFLRAREVGFVRILLFVLVLVLSATRVLIVALALDLRFPVPIPIVLRS